MVVTTITLYFSEVFFMYNIRSLAPTSLRQAGQNILSPRSWGPQLWVGTKQGGLALGFGCLCPRLSVCPSRMAPTNLPPWCPALQDRAGLLWINPHAGWHSPLSPSWALLRLNEAGVWKGLLWKRACGPAGWRKPDQSKTVAASEGSLCALTSVWSGNMEWVFF